MGWLILIGIVALCVWIDSKDDGKGNNTAGAIASIAAGMAAGKALNKKLTGDVDSIDVKKIHKEREDEQRQYEEDERRRQKEQHKWREDTEFDPDRKW